MNYPPISHFDKHDINRLRDIVITLKQGKCNATNFEYLQCVQNVYGTKKVQEICSRYQLFRKGSETKLLKVGDVKKLQQGLNDIRCADLDKFIKKLLRNDPLYRKEIDVLEALGKEVVEQIKQYTTSSELPPAVFNVLVEVFQIPNIKYQDLKFSSTLTLGRIRGVPGKYLLGWSSHQAGRSLEDKEREKIYEEIQSLKSHEQPRYCEVLSKLLVKKHLYYEQKNSNKIKLGMLVPALQGPNGEKRWYRVNEIIDSGWGKFAYRLIPATKQYSADMPDLLLYRSSSTLPSSIDSFTSYLNDINVLPPGYLSRNRSKKKEIRWLNDVSKTNEGKIRPLVITGHSLGASHSQIALINLFKSGKWIDRKISVELFDSPAITAKDAREFAKWYNIQKFTKPITLNYYLSKGDPVPLVGSLTGSSYLGNYITKNTLKATVHKMQLTKKGFNKSEISGFGPHGRMFFRGKEGRDFRTIKVTIQAFDQDNKYLRILLNIVKIIGVLFIWVTLGVSGGLKRFFIGRRHHDPVIVKLFRKITQIA